MGAVLRLSHTQSAAIAHPGNVALTSCPGSGKTRTLVAKLLQSVAEVHDSTRLIACITYTNAAVNEIESRLEQLSPTGSKRCEIETIHSFCLRHIITPHHWTLPVFRAGFKVLGVDDAAFREIVGKIVAAFRLDRYALKDFEALGRGTGILPETIPQPAADAYWAELDRRRLMDFSSIIYWSAKILHGATHVASGLASRYRWILVDEFQDTSSLHW